MSINFDDLDLDDMDFGDEFPDFDEGESVNPTDRQPLDSIRDGALDAATDPSTYKDAAKAIARNALPEGYAEAADGLSELKDLIGTATETAEKELRNSGKVLRDIALKHEKLASKILPESFLEKLKQDKEFDKTPTGLSQDQKDTAEITAALGNIFKTNSEAENERAIAEGRKNDVVNKATLSFQKGQMRNSEALYDAMNRIVSFNDTIVSQYYSKSLELEFKQYFALRDIRDTQIAYFKDTNPKFDAIVKNTGLPDIIKGQLSEEYGALARERLLGAVNDTMTNKMANYFGKVKQNVTRKVKDVAGGIASGIEQAGSMLLMEGMDDLPQDMKTQMMASMATGLVIEGIGGELGNKLAKVLKRYPKVANTGLELLYLKDNAPQLLDALLKDGSDSEIAQRIMNVKGQFDDKISGTVNKVKGSFSAVGNKAASYIPDSVKEKLNKFRPAKKDPFFEEEDMFADIGEQKKKLNTDNFFMRTVKELLPSLGDNTLSFNNTLIEEGYKAVSLDVAMRASIVDIIPGLLTEQVRLTTKLVDGTDANALQYDRLSGQFLSRKQVNEEISNEFLDSLGTEVKSKRLNNFIKILDPNNTLDNSDKKQIFETILKQANGFNGSVAFSYDKLVNALSGETKSKVSALVGAISSKSEEQQIKTRSFFAREYARFADDFDKAQQNVYNLVNAGARQDLINSGYFIQDPKDKDKQILNYQKLFNDMSNIALEQNVDFGTNESTLSEDGASINISKDITIDLGPVKEILNAISLKLPELFNYEGMDAVPVYVVNNMQGPEVEGNTTHAKYGEYNDLRNAFFENREGLYGVPVFMQSTQGEFGDPEVERTNAMLDSMNDFKQKFIDGTANTHGLLAGILQGVSEIDSVAVDGLRSSSFGRFMGGLGKFAKGAGVGAGTFMQRYYTGLGKFFRGAGSGARNVLGGAGDFFFGRKTIGENGEMKQVSTRNPLKSILGMTTGMVSSLFNAQKTFFERIGDFGRSIIGGMKWLNDKTESVYVGGEGSPRLLASIFRRGGYFNSKGERLYSHLEIDGDVFDANGEVILSSQEISSKGIFGKDGKELSGGRLRSIFEGGKNLIKGGFRLTGKAIKASMSATATILKGVGKGIGLAGGGIIGSLFNKDMALTDLIKGQVSKSSKVDTDTIDKIYRHMTSKWPLTQEEIRFSKKYGRTPPKEEDVDSTKSALHSLIERMKAVQDKENEKKEIRKGSWQDKILNKKDKTNKKDPKKTKEKEEKDSNNGMMLTLLTGLASGVTGLVSSIKELVMAKSAASAAGSVLDAAGDMAGSRGGKAGKAGKASKIGSIAKTLGDAALTGGKWLGRAAMSVGGTALRLAGGGAGLLARGAVAAGSALLGSAAAPVIGAALAGYTVYKAASWFIGRMDAEPYELIRFMQYGFTGDQGGVLSMIRDAEEYVLDDVKIEKGQVVYNKPTNPEIAEELSDIFGWGNPTIEEKEKILNWFHERFLPVLIWHTGAAISLDASYDITDIDDEIAEKHKIPFLNAINQDKFLEKDFYRIMTSPIPGLELVNQKSKIRTMIEAELTKAGAKIETKEKDNAPKFAHPDAVKRNDMEDKDGDDSIYEDADKAAKEKARRVEAAARMASYGGTATSYSADAKTSATATPSNVGNKYPTVNYSAGDKGATPSELRPELGKFSMYLPVSNKLRISSPYGWRNHPIGGKRTFHKGVDFAGPEGEPVYAAKAGTIIRIQYSDSYGNVIYIRHSNGWCTRYAHMSKFASGLKLGTQVKDEQLIGYIGNTGKSAGNHLHFELRLGDLWNSETDDPMKYIASVNKGSASGVLKPADKPYTPEKAVLEGTQAVKANGPEDYDQAKEIASKDGNATTMINGDVSVDAKNNNVKVVEDGTILSMGYDPSLGRYVLVKGASGRTFLYRGFESMPKGLTKGMEVTKGSSLASSKAYTVTAFNGAAKDSALTPAVAVGDTPIDKVKIEAADAIIAKTTLPITDPNGSLENIVKSADTKGSDFMKKDDFVNYSNASEKMKSVHNDVVPTPKKEPIRAPSAMVTKEDKIAELARNAMSQYYTTATEQRDKIIDLLELIKDGLASLPNAVSTPQTRETTQRPKQSQASVRQQQERKLAFTSSRANNTTY